MVFIWLSVLGAQINIEVCVFRIDDVALESQGAIATIKVHFAENKTAWRDNELVESIELQVCISILSTCYYAFHVLLKSQHFFVKLKFLFFKRIMVNLLNTFWQLFFFPFLKHSDLVRQSQIISFGLFWLETDSVVSFLPATISH